MRYNTNSFIEKAKNIHGNKYNYDLVEYVSCLSPIKIICKIHGEFEQKPQYHLQKNGCPKCGKISYKEKMSFTKEKIIELAEPIHKENFIWESLEYNGLYKKSFIDCSIHGRIEIKLINMIRGHGCIKCGNNQITFEEFVKEANKIHNNKYIYVKNSWQGRITDRIEIICPIHGFFKQRGNKHTRDGKQGCPRCKSRHSKMQIQWLKSFNNENIIIGYKIKNIGEVDGYDPSTNTVYEFHGDFWHGNPKIFNQNDLHPMLNTSYGELYSKTIKRDNKIRSEGYNLISIFESDYSKSNF